MELIRIEGIEKRYWNGEEEIRALDDLNLKIEQGEFVAIVGPSGSGKSTLMNVLGCLDLPTCGKYYLNGENVAKISEDRLSRIRNTEIGFVFQGFNLIPTLDALENVELPLVYRGLRKTERRSLSREALVRVGLEKRLYHRPGQMSGGQQQRVAIARAIAARPPVILADEPTGNLDSQSGQEVMEILKSLNREGRTVILITHDDKIAAQAKRKIQIQDGKLVEMCS
ncbi:MAG: ABC transporter ATP-binding protein [Clostridium sp.]|uniref:ABC transporter ATP-binding protein n=1 Tax=Clostridium sp. TaxID=1506 RepID=UPI0029079D62|nr:ABC transporter ATP-binding protein [Clostridium sp.]MDU7338470.1 ABC transporter ATP-binding protein [Clostridium sp.]